MIELAFREIKPTVLVKKARTRYLIIPAMVIRRCDLLGVQFEDENLFDLYIDVNEENQSIELVYKMKKEEG